MSTAPGRNEPCPCGSKKKYKHCCLLKRSQPRRASWAWVIFAGAALAVAGGGVALTRRHARDTGPAVSAASNAPAAPKPGPGGSEPAEAFRAKTAAELQADWQTWVKEANWQRALEIARSVTALSEDNSSGWLMQAYCLHELNCTKEAFELLGGVIEKFPGEELPAYNLACYACQVDKLDDARRWLKQAMQVGEAERVKTKALKDSDLKPLWPEIERM